MNLKDAYDNWENFTSSGKKEVLTTLIHDLYRNDHLDMDEVLDFVGSYVEWEDEDFFGTEGLQV